MSFFTECRLEVDETVTISDNNKDKKKFSYWGEQFLISFDLTLSNAELPTILNVVQMMSKDKKNVPKFFLNTKEQKFYASYEGKNSQISVSQKINQKLEEFAVEIKQSVNKKDGNYQFCLKINEEEECKVIDNPEELQDVEVFLAQTDALTDKYGEVKNLNILNLACFEGK